MNFSKEILELGIYVDGAPASLNEAQERELQYAKENKC